MISRQFLNFLQAQDANGRSFLVSALKEEMYEVYHETSGDLNKGLDAKIAGETASSLVASSGYTADDLKAFAKVVENWYSEQESVHGQLFTPEQLNWLKTMSELYEQAMAGAAGTSTLADPGFLTSPQAMATKVTEDLYNSTSAAMDKIYRSA